MPIDKTTRIGLPEKGDRSFPNEMIVRWVESGLNGVPDTVILLPENHRGSCGKEPANP